MFEVCTIMVSDALRLRVKRTRTSVSEAGFVEALISLLVCVIPVPPYYLLEGVLLPFLQASCLFPPKCPAPSFAQHPSGLGYHLQASIRDSVKSASCDGLCSG